MKRGFASLGVVLAVSALLLAPVFGAGATTADAATADEPMLHVALSEDGSATMSLVMSYDFADEDERNAFETLETDDQARADLLERFRDRMQTTADAVDRDATVTADAVDVRTADDRGVVALSVQWDGFATVEGDQLVVTEPFASGYEADHPVVITAPAESTIETTTPEPTDRTDQRVTWAAGTDFDGFEATVSLSEGSATADGSDSVPGFGSVAAGSAVLALLGAVLRVRG